MLLTKIKELHNNGIWRSSQCIHYFKKTKKKKTNGMLINHYTKSVGKEHWGHKMGWEL